MSPSSAGHSRSTADGAMTGNAARIVFTLLALAYLVLLTGLLGFRILMLPTLMPQGWPGDPGKAQAPWAVLAFFGALVVSTCVAWYLVIGFVARGRDWLGRRAKWLKAAALFAPLC